MIINVIPLAGKGQRFLNEGYTIPKPLIDVDDEKMIFKAFNSLPVSDKNIFICLQQHIDIYEIDKLIKNKVPNSLIIPDFKPKGQASSTYLIKDYVNEFDTLNIGACDNSMLYDINKYYDFLRDDNIDFFVWTFKNYHGVNYNPDQYSYCVVDDFNNIELISLKKSISNTPILDNCLVGAFTFKKSKYLIDNYEELLMNNDTVNGEFYIDSIINYCLKNGLKGKVFEIDKYIGFGTPSDLKTYQYWHSYFKYN